MYILTDKSYITTTFLKVSFLERQCNAACNRLWCNMSVSKVIEKTQKQTNKQTKNMNWTFSKIFGEKSGTKTQNCIIHFFNVITQFQVWQLLTKIPDLNCQ